MVENLRNRTWRHPQIKKVHAWKLPSAKIDGLAVSKRTNEEQAMHSM